MKKVYLNPARYLLNKNSEGDGVGAGGTGGENAEGTGAPDSSVGSPGSEGQSQPAVIPDWKESIPSELKDNPRFANVETLDDVLKAFASIKEAPVVPETMTLPEGVPAEIGTWAVENGLTQEQFDATLNQYATIEKGRLESVMAANKEGEAALYEQWGDAKKENLQLADRVVQFADPDGKLKLGEFLKSPASNYAYNNPMILTLFHNIGKAMKEGGALRSTTPPSGAVTKKVNKAHEMYPEQAPKN